MKTLAQIFILIALCGCADVSPVALLTPAPSTAPLDTDPRHAKAFVSAISKAQPLTVIQPAPTSGNAFTYSIPLTNCWIEVSFDLVHWRNANLNYDYTMSTNSDGKWSLIPNMNMAYAFYTVFGEQQQ